MSGEILKCWHRIIDSDIRQLFTRELIAGKTDSQALDKIHDGLCTEPVRKKRNELKEIYALLIWNINPKDANPIWKHAELRNGSVGRALNAKDIEALSQIEQHLKTLSTARGIKRSKWAYICAVRDIEPLRVYHNRDSGIEMTSSAMSPRKSFTNCKEPSSSEGNKGDRCVDDNNHSETPTSPGFERKSSGNSIYLVAARNQLAIRSLEKRIIDYELLEKRVVAYEARLTKYEEQLRGLRAIIDRLIARSSSKNKGGYMSKEAEKSDYCQSSAGQFVFFDTA